jgi:hypothetical protein
MNINLHIERLVLDGINISPSQRDLLQASITTELVQLLNNGALVDNFVEGDALSRLATNSIQLTINKPVELGKQIAQSVYGGIGRE